MAKKKVNSLVAAKAGVSKLRSNEDIRQWLRELSTEIDPQHILEKVKKCVDNGKKLEETHETVERAIAVLGHERHYLVAESVTDERWRSMVIDLAQCLEKEHDCTTHSEISLAGIAAASYYRYLRATRTINTLLSADSMGSVGVQLVAHASKEADRAYRQYLTAIETFRVRRQPQMNVKIQTKAAFFNEHQTINTNRDPYAENNDPQ